jgi:O-antigen ligase
LFIIPVSLWASSDLTTSWVAAGYLLWGVALYFALLYWPPAQQQPAWAAGLLALFGVLIASASLPLVVWKPQFRLFYFPLYDWLQTVHLDVGETIHANVLASLLVLIMPLLLALLLSSKAMCSDPLPLSRGGRWQLLFGLLFLWAGFLLLLTQSRAGYLAIVTALPVVLLLRWPRLGYLLPFAVMVVAAMSWRIGLPVILEQLSSDGTLGGWEGRLEIWSRSYQAFQDFPFTGIGLGTFTTVMPLLYPLRVTIDSYPHAHNLFLHIGLDLGLFGLIAYLALLINLFVMLTGVLRRSPRNRLHWSLATGALGSLVALLVHGLLDAPMWGTKIAFLPWLLYALITLLFLHTSVR